MSTSTSHLMGLAVLATAAASIAGCGDQGSATKSGARAESRVTLRLEMPDAGDAQGRFFADDVARRSHGSVPIRIDPTGYPSALPANELELAHALQAGKEDIAYLPARAWAAASVAQYRALMAPFVITTDAATAAVASGSAGSALLHALPESVIGIGLIAAEPRRVLSTRQALTPSAFAGLRVRLNDNPQTDATFRALGAIPVQGIDSHETMARLTGGRLDAIESSPTNILINRYQQHATELTGYAVLPKLESIVLSRRAWDRLSDAQRAAVRAAAEDTVAVAVQAVPEQERRELEQMCGLKVRIGVPSAPELSRLAAATEPAVTADPKARATLAALRALPGSGPQPLASPLPAACGLANSTKPGTKQTAATFPEGVYVTTDTVADFRAEGISGPDWNKDITWTTTLRDGHFRVTQVPDDPDQGPLVGNYTVHGDQVRFTYTHSPDGELPETVTWSYYDRMLRFKSVQVADAGARVQFEAHPWRKVL